MQRVAWCTGAAQGYLEDAVRLGVDVFITVKSPSRPCISRAKAASRSSPPAHHATERYGVQALGAILLIASGSRTSPSTFRIRSDIGGNVRGEPAANGLAFCAGANL